NFVVWNDQFYNDPPIKGCGTSCNTPWGHAKGVVAWDDAGNGVVMQVTTPSWPGSGNKSHQRAAGNTLGCVANDPDVVVAQHFFAVKLSPADLPLVLEALANAGVVTDTANPQLVKNGGPAAIQSAVKRLGVSSTSNQVLWKQLSTDKIQIISKGPKAWAP